MEFHPVILCGGQGTKLYPLAEQMPKALLAIANKPVIWYVIEFLHKYGFEEAIIVSQPTFFDKIKSSVDTFISVYNIPIKLECLRLPCDKLTEMGTADALRYIQPHIKSDLLILPCDILIDIPLQQFANIHRCYNSALTILLTPQIQNTPADQSAGAMKTYKAGRDVIALAEKSDRILLLQNESDIDEKLSLTRSMLLKYPCLELRTDLRDTHVYLMSKSVLDVLNDSKGKKISSIKEELIPLILQKQLTDYKLVSTNPLATDSASAYNPLNDLELLAYQLSETNRSGRLDRIMVNGAIQEIYYTYACYQMILNSPQIALRISTVQDFIEGNKLMQKEANRMNLWPIERDHGLVHESVEITGAVERVVGKETYIGECSRIDEGCSLKKSIIGVHVILGKNVKVSNSIILERVVIEDNCQIINSIQNQLLSLENQILKGKHCLEMRWYFNFRVIWRHEHCLMASKHRNSPSLEMQLKNGQVKMFKKGILHSSWKNRHLKLNRNYLLVFETQHTYQPLESIIRDEIRSVRKLADVDNGFEIKVKEFECYTFQCINPDDLEEWVAALENRVPISSARLDSQAQVAQAVRQAGKSDFPAQFEAQPAVLYPGLPASEKPNDQTQPPPYNTMY
ncbi:hypothetical protein LOD99_13514 [Oopsacas minuta]|uniref:Translation initiation factor eIF2B subunit gamma n=1 Tax=Oopsacas minuta TaxID=111878 RepID=A0AAV7KJM9_9METZ|nr:hypothetical protein LOD99_13514 [Oopsacas minuta]